MMASLIGFFIQHFSFKGTTILDDVTAAYKFSQSGEDFNSSNEMIDAHGYMSNKQTSCITELPIIMREIPRRLTN